MFSLLTNHCRALFNQCPIMKYFSQWYCCSECLAVGSYYQAIPCFAVNGGWGIIVRLPSCGLHANYFTTHPCHQSIEESANSGSRLWPHSWTGNVFYCFLPFWKSWPSWLQMNALCQVFQLVSHLVSWGKATIIYPLCESNVYVLGPKTNTSVWVCCAALCLIGIHF